MSDEERPPPDPHGKRIGELLVEAGDLEREELAGAVERARRTRKPLGELLIELGVVDEREVYRQLAAQYGLPLGDVDALLASADRSLAKAVPLRFLERARVLPLRREGATVLVVTSDPRAEAIELARALGAEQVSLQLVSPTDLQRLWLALELGQLGGAQPEEHAPEVRDLVSADVRLDPQLIALFEALLLDAIGERASDLHVESYEGWVRVRLRIDGELHDVPRYQLTPAQAAGLVNVVKVRAGMDIAERRLGQAGRISTAAHGRIFDLRVQTQPTPYGEHVAIRLLPRRGGLLPLSKLGFPESAAQAYRRSLDSPNGLVLVVGPSGAGKTTTLYAGLGILAADASRKVITAEDPIEFSLPGVVQTQVNPAIGFSFSQAVRTFVRQDPDALLIGEIRDPETALEALRASQTGHLVLSTLHCNDSVDAVQRLLDLGMHPNSVASELSHVFAQRLARRLCTECREPARPSPELLAEVFPHGPPAGFAAYRGGGCKRCEGRGTYGRVAVVEHLAIRSRLRMGIARRLPLDELRALARATGLVPLREQALRLVRDGVIAFEELRAVLSLEQLAGTV